MYSIYGLLIDSNARERDWKRDHVRPLATIESQEIILATDRFLLWKLFLPAEAILGPVFNFLHVEQNTSTERNSSSGTLNYCVSWIATAKSWECAEILF